MSADNGRKRLWLYAPIAIAAWTVFSGVGGWFVGIGRNEARLTAVEEYIKLNQTMVLQRSERLIANEQGIMQMRGDLEDMEARHRLEMAELRETVRRAVDKLEAAAAEVRRR